MDQIFFADDKRSPFPSSCGKILQPVKSGNEPNVVRRNSFQDARAYHQQPNLGSLTHLKVSKKKCFGEAEFNPDLPTRICLQALPIGQKGLWGDLFLKESNVISPLPALICAMLFW